MIFNETEIEDVFLIKPEKHIDNRGSFMRTFDKNDFFHQYIHFNIIQTSLSYNPSKGTLRGMHYQDIPHQEERIVQCVNGSIYDVVLDLREYSKTYKHWQAFNLNDKNNTMLYVGAGIAHGFQTLEDNSTILYYMNTEYYPLSSKIVKYDDERFNISWKLPITNISEKDNNGGLIKLK